MKKLFLLTVALLAAPLAAQDAASTGSNSATGVQGSTASGGTGGGLQVNNATATNTSFAIANSASPGGPVAFDTATTFTSSTGAVTTDSLSLGNAVGASGAGQVGIADASAFSNPGFGDAAGAQSNTGVASQAFSSTAFAGFSTQFSAVDSNSFASAAASPTGGTTTFTDVNGASLSLGANIGVAVGDAGSLFGSGGNATATSQQP